MRPTSGQGTSFGIPKRFRYLVRIPHPLEVSLCMHSPFIRVGGGGGGGYAALYIAAFCFFNHRYYSDLHLSTPNRSRGWVNKIPRHLPAYCFFYIIMMGGSLYLSMIATVHDWQVSDLLISTSIFCRGSPWHRLVSDGPVCRENVRQSPVLAVISRVLTPRPAFAVNTRGDVPV